MRFKDIVLVMWCLRMMMVCLLLILSFFMISAQNFSESQKDDFCDYFNYSYIECYELWDAVDKLDSNFTCEVCNYSNYTISSECFNLVDCNCTEEEPLTKIDDYAKRGFEPVFEGGVIVNWKKIGNDSCEAFDCRQQCSEAVEAVKRQYEGNSESGEDDVSKQNSVFVLFLVGVVVLGIGYFAFKKIRKSSVKFVPPEDGEGYVHPKPKVLPEPSRPVNCKQDKGVVSEGQDNDF